MKSKNSKRKICVISGKRGGFGSLIRTMNLIEKDPKLELQLIITDMHLSSKFGKTLAEVEKLFKVSAFVDMKQKGDSSVARSEAMGLCLKEVSKTLHKLKPDIFLCLGDRGEVLVSVIAANNLRIPVAHVQGGDISGNLDEVFRHAITKMSHIHFPSTPESARRIEKMGEESWRINIVGDTHLDLIHHKMYTKNSKTREKYKIGPKEKYLLVIHHPVNTEPDKSYKQMETILRGVKKIGLKTIIIYPCSDQGYQGIIKAIKEEKDNKDFLVYKNINAPDFLGLMSGAEVLIGNSSSGIIEAPMFKLPTINIGKRQTGRLRDFNIIDIDGKTAKEITNTIHFALTDETYRHSLKQCGNIYGKGNVGEKIVKVLKKVKLDDRLFEKRVTY